MDQGPVLTGPPVREHQRYEASLEDPPDSGCITVESAEYHHQTGPATTRPSVWVAIESRNYTAEKVRGFARELLRAAEALEEITS